METINNKNSHKVGSIFSTSWGYDQTNVEFYEVTERPSPHFVVIREIGQNVEAESWSSNRVTPAPGRYIGDPIRKKITPNGLIKIDHIYATPTDPEKSHYATSVYAGH